MGEVEDFYREHPEFLEDDDHRTETERKGGRRVMLNADPTESLTGWAAPNHLLHRSLGLQERELRVRIERVVDALPEDRGDLLRRLYWEHQTEEEAAAGLSISQQAVSQRLEAALGDFRRRLATMFRAGDLDTIEEEEL